MRLIPTFVVRSGLWLVFFQALLIWLALKTHKIPLSPPIHFLLQGTLGTTITNIKDILDVKLGFASPWEAHFMLPLLLDRYITTTMPDLTILLGKSPCSREVAHMHAETGMCTQLLAYSCYQHAAHMERGDMFFHVLRTCFEEYQVSARQAQLHFNTCHSGKTDVFVGLTRLACERSKIRLEKEREVCLMVPPFVDCGMQYSRWDLLQPILKGQFDEEDYKLRGTCSRIFASSGRYVLFSLEEYSRIHLGNRQAQRHRYENRGCG